MMDPRLALAIAIGTGCVFTWTTLAADDESGRDVEKPCPTEEADPAYLQAGDDEEVIVKFDRAQLNAAGRNVIEGSVSIRFGDTCIATETAEYDTEAQTVLFPGSLVATTPLITLKGANGRSDLNEQSFSVEEIEFSQLAQEWQGNAARILVTNTSLRIERPSVSTCPIGSEAWTIGARDITAKIDTSHISVKDAIIRLGGIPVFYLPWLRFPSGSGVSGGSGRVSGILLPNVESDSALGIDVSVPLYLNLAPNYDLTIVPRVQTEWGLGMDVEFRVLMAGSPLVFQLATLRETFAEEGSESESFHRAPIDSTLWNISATHEAYVPRWSSWIRYEDSNFTSGRSETSWMPSLMAFRFLHNALEIGVRIQRPVPRIDGLVAYSTMPTIEFEWMNRSWLGDIRHSGSFSSFHAHKDGLPVSVNSGMRAHLDSTYYRPLRMGALHLYGGTTSHLTGYSIQRSRSGQNLAEARSAQSIFAGAKIRALRDFSMAADSYRQTLDLRFQYVTRLFTEYDYILVEQSDLAQFDNGWRTYNVDMLFDIWQVNGRDRLPDREDVAFGIETRLFRLNDGFEVLSASLGVLHKFQANGVQVGPGIAAIHRPKTRTVASLEFAPTGRLTARMGGSWPRGASELEQSYLSTVYRSENGTVFHADMVRYPWSNLEAYDLGAFVPVTKKWAVFGRKRHDQQHDRNVESFLGIEYQSCCMTVRILGRKYLRPDLTGGLANLNQNTSVLLQISLKGLGTLGSRLESVLSRGIPELSGVDENEWIGEPTLAW